MLEDLGNECVTFCVGGITRGCAVVVSALSSPPKTFVRFMACWASIFGNYRLLSLHSRRCCPGAQAECSPYRSRPISTQAMMLERRREGWRAQSGRLECRSFAIPLRDRV